ncbi:MAG: hypothetical protein ACHQ4G_10890 [Opitutales bacterium]
MPDVISPCPTRLPLWMKIVCTLFVCVIVPYYWHEYGPLNFLYFCDVALLVTLPALWLENRFLLSMQTVAIIIGQALWLIDFAAHAVSPSGLTGMTDYMFDPRYKLFVRGLSLFHVWLPFLLLYSVWKLGYDRRAFAVQCVCGIAILLVCYFFTPGPPRANLNNVFGLSKERPQDWMAPGLWLALLLAAFPLLFYLPAHLALSRWCRRPRRNCEPRRNDERRPPRRNDESQ